MEKISAMSLRLAVVACIGLGGCGLDPAAMHGGTNPGGTSDPNEGTSCMSDRDCAGGYACQGTQSMMGPGCTPNRSCTADECGAICESRGAIDPMTGQPLAACVADCEAHALCCSGSGTGGGSTAGKCRKSGGGIVDPGPDAGSGQKPMPIAWAGTWNANVSYTVACDYGFGNIKKGTHMHTVSIKIEGANSSLTGVPQTPTSGWNPMTGTGDDGGLTLSGPFPFRDHSGTTVADIDNNVTLKITSVTSSKQASGTIEGSAKEQFGSRCTISGGTLTFAR